MQTSLRPGDTLGHYVVREMLGEGGMAVVYRVHDTQRDADFALKLLTVQSESLTSRFMQEGKLRN